MWKVCDLVFLHYSITFLIFFIVHAKVDFYEFQK